MLRLLGLFLFLASVCSIPAIAEYKLEYDKHKQVVLQELKSAEVSEIYHEGYSQWNEAWTDEYFDSHFVYFPFVYEAVGYSPNTKDKVDERWSVCHLTTRNFKNIPESSRSYMLDEAASAAAFFLWQTEAWNEDAFSSGETAAEILASYRYRRLDNFSPRRASQLVNRIYHCDAYFAEVDAAKIFVEHYLQHEQVVARNSVNEDWFTLEDGISFVPKNAFLEASAKLFGFEDQNHRTAYRAGYTSYAEMQAAEAKIRAEELKAAEAVKLAKQRKAQLDLLAEKSFSKFDENVTQGFLSLKEKFDQSFKARLPYKDPGNFVTNLFRNNSIFAETPSMDALNALDASLQTATLGLFQSNLFRKFPHSMKGGEGDFLKFGDLVCRSGIMRRDLRQYFSDHHLFTGGNYGYESVDAKKNYLINGCFGDHIWFEVPWADIGHLIIRNKQNNNKMAFPKETVLKAQNARIIPKEWYNSGDRNEGIAGNYVGNGSKHDIIIPIGRVALNGQLWNPPWFNEPSDGGYIQFREEVCQAILKPIQKYLPTNQTCHIMHDLGLAGSLSIDENGLEAHFGWKNIDGKSYLYYRLVAGLGKRSKALNTIIYKSEVRGNRTDTEGNNIKSDWQLIPRVHATGLDPAQKLNSNSNVLDVWTVQIHHTPSIENNNIVIKRRLELHGFLIDPSSGLPDGDSATIFVDADDSKEILEAVLKLLGNSYSQ